MHVLTQPLHTRKGNSKAEFNWLEFRNVPPPRSTGVRLVN